MWIPIPSEQQKLNAWNKATLHASDPKGNATEMLLIIKHDHSNQHKICALLPPMIEKKRAVITLYIIEIYVKLFHNIVVRA